MNKEKTDKLDQLLPSFLDSTREVFETMVFMPITAGNITSKSPGGPFGAVSGTISLTGEDVTGTLSLIFEMPLATAIFRSMMGMDKASPVNSQELNDIVGELANMVAGGAKSRLQDKGVHFKIGLPTVVVGNNHYLDPPKEVATAIATISGSEGSFYLELSF
jgi:chemotaxis protein CheX